MELIALLIIVAIAVGSLSLPVRWSIGLLVLAAIAGVMTVGLGFLKVRPHLPLEPILVGGIFGLLLVITAGLILGLISRTLSPNARWSVVGMALVLVGISLARVTYIERSRFDHSSPLVSDFIEGRGWPAPFMIDLPENPNFKWAPGDRVDHSAFLFDWLFFFIFIALIVFAARKLLGGKMYQRFQAAVKALLQGRRFE